VISSRHSSDSEVEKKLAQYRQKLLNNFRRAILDIRNNSLNIDLSEEEDLDND
jgi:hypothetical protein